MKTKKIQTQIPQLDIQGRFMPETIDVEKRTIEMTFTTSAPTRMARWKGWDIEKYNEILSMEKGHVRMERMLKGAPLLDNHNRWGGVKSQLGVVVKAWTEGDELRGIVRFSKRAEADAVFRDVQDGIIRNGSIGYVVHKYQDESKEGDSIKTLRAIDWEPMEMSLVPIPADHNAQVRAAGGEESDPQLFDVEIETRNFNERKTMKVKKQQEETEQQTDTPAVELPADTEQIRAEERARNAKIIRAVRQAKLPATFAETLIASGKTYETCLEEIQAKWAEQDATAVRGSGSATTVEVTGEFDEVSNRVQGAAEAILYRTAPAEHKLTERARPFAGRSAMDLARHILELNGIRTAGMGPNDIIHRAFHSTSDFTNILSDVAQKRLQKAYESVPQIFKKFATETTLPDFKNMNVVSLGEAAALELLPEGAEIKMGTIADSKEAYKLATYAKGLPVTRQAMLNDDLGAFSKSAAAFGREGARLENKVGFTNALIANPTMGDSVAVFHANHKNLISSSPGTPAEAQLAKMKAMMRKQVDDKGNILSLVPKWWIVGADYEVDAKKVVAAQSTSGGYNVFGEEFQLLVWPELTTDHYIVADPNMVEGLEYAYLEGARGIQMSQEVHAGTLGVVIRCWLDFGAKVINHRAFVKNPGA